MKAFKTFQVVLLLLTSTKSWASEIREIRSAPVGDLVGVAVQNIPTSITNNERIFYGVFSSARPCPVIYRLKNDYLCVVRVFGPDGRLLEANKEGRVLGKRFAELKPSAKINWNDASKFIEMKPPHGTQVSEVAVWNIAETNSPQYSLPPIGELFAITSPGVYRLEMQFQVIEAAESGQRELAGTVIRFDPIEIQFIK